MTATSTITVGTTPRLIASAYLSLVTVENTGTVPVRVLSQPGDADHGRVIAPDTLAELLSSDRSGSLFLVADEDTDVVLRLSTLQDLREEAAESTGVPLARLRGDTRDEIAASAALHQLRMAAADAAGISDRMVHGDNAAEIATSVNRWSHRNGFRHGWEATVAEFAG